MNNSWNFLADSFLASWNWFSGKNIFVAIRPTFHKFLPDIDMQG